jgi:hypothetical protein
MPIQQKSQTQFVNEKHTECTGILNKILSIIATKKFKSRIGKVLIHFPLEKIDEIVNINNNCDTYELNCKNGKILITDKDIICSRNEDQKHNRNPLYLLSELKSGHPEQSCFLLNDGVTINDYIIKLKDKIQSYINVLDFHKENNDPIINQFQIVKNVTDELNGFFHQGPQGIIPDNQRSYSNQ